jgi:hypothetical protein
MTWSIGTWYTLAAMPAQRSGHRTGNQPTVEER